MPKRVCCMLILAACATLPLAPAAAKVTQEEAERLKKDLTPIGAERAGNADGTIPPWTGGLATVPQCFKGPGARYCDPFPEEQPRFTITAANAAQHRERLTAGQLAMLKKYPGSYKLVVYPTRRTAAYPEHVYEATYRNALNAELTGGGEGIAHAIIGVPFPIPRSGVEPVINHKTRYRGESLRRWSSQAAVTTSGDYNLVKLREDLRFSYSLKGATPESLDNVLFYFLQVVEQPPRLAGTILLVHETMDQIKEPRRAWQYNPGQKRLRRAPNVGYDNPGTAADGLRTNDQMDSFNGATDRYSWKLLGKREMYIPYNAYRLHSDRYKISDIVKKSHVNQDLPRYELHRVWVVEATVKGGTSHLYARRVFYLDEDTWQIVLVDIYDARGQLWRWQEAHPYQAYDKPHPGLPALETVYDLLSNRYIAYNMNNEDDEVRDQRFEPSYFEPVNVQKQTIK